MPYRTDLNSPPAEALMNLSHSALDTYRGKNRILLVFYPSSVDPLYKTQLNEINKHEEDLKERDLIVIEVGPSDTRNLRQDFQVSFFMIKTKYLK